MKPMAVVDWLTDDPVSQLPPAPPTKFVLSIDRSPLSCNTWMPSLNCCTSAGLVPLRKAMPVVHVARDARFGRPPRTQIKGLDGVRKDVDGARRPVGSQVAQHRLVPGARVQDVYASTPPHAPDEGSKLPVDDVVGNSLERVVALYLFIRRHDAIAQAQPWQVDGGRGHGLALEVVDRGDRRVDLRKGVWRYACSMQCQCLSATCCTVRNAARLAV